MASASESFSHARSGVVVFGVMLVMFLFAIDTTIVGAAMPTVVSKLGGLELYSWVFSTYLLTSALVTPLSGKLSDLYGQRRLMLIGIALFIVGSALCGMAQSMEQLIVFRALQGIGGGAIYALSFIIVGFLFPPEERAKMQGLISGLWGIASILGPLAGGLITQYWNWRWIFFVNLPICCFALLFIFFGLTEKRGSQRPTLDLKGAATLLCGLFLIFYALEESRRNVRLFDLGLIAWLLLSAFTALLLFYRIERRAKEPILPLSLFRLPLFGICAAIALVASMAMFGVISFLPLYVQGVLGDSASSAGLTLLVASLGWTAGSFITGHGMNRFGYRLVCVAGMLLMILGYAALLSASGTLNLMATLAISSVVGMGMGIVNLTSMVAAQNSVPLNQLGTATSTVMLCRMLGGALGLSLMGNVLFGQMERQLASLFSESKLPLAAGLIKKLANPENLLDSATRSSIPDVLLNALIDILARSLWYAFVTGFLITLAGLLLSFFVVDPGSAKRQPAMTIE